MRLCEVRSEGFDRGADIHTPAMAQIGLVVGGWEGGIILVLGRAELVRIRLVTDYGAGPVETGLDWIGNISGRDVRSADARLDR